MSGSSLAPFVAAILRDRTVTELNQENEELRKQLNNERDKKFIVEVIDKEGIGDGTQVHFQASLKDGYAADKLEYAWTVDFKHNEVIYIDDICCEFIEIRLGGIPIEKFKKRTLYYYDISFHGFDREHQMGSLEIRMDHGPSPITTLVTKIGPIPTEADYDYLRRQAYTMGELMDAINEEPDQFNVVPDNLIITQIQFRKEDISGIMTLLENMGISTAYDNENENMDD
jgi:hypothetical protein